MTPERYAQVQALFTRVRRTPHAERAQLMAEACGDDADLRREVESLLAHSATPLEAATPTLLGREAADFLSDWENTNKVAPPPAEVGPYRILGPLGEGGMGVVYLAEQTAPVRRRVALKLIKLGMDTREVVARFESERQALAMMNHPNVASVLDAGATAEGRPYFVMEHVPGVPVTDYCDAQRLSIRKRLDLFIPICNAVHHAHQKGVIHRDIKPSNILVAEHDGEAVPKVIDFGVAKAVSQPLTLRTLHTQQGRLLGTPEYMAPEQAGTSGVDVDTRADIYSLGVLLYQLLTGRLPLTTKELGQARYDQIIRAIRETAPPKPSTRAAARDADGARMARSRSSDPRALERELRGDLDWIVMKALDKERARRYESAAGLAQDIERYLRSEPVLARQPSALYRFSKLVHRHRAGVAATLVVFLALLGGIVGTSVGLFRARAAESVARAERDAAELAQRRESAAKSSAESARAQADEQAEALRRALYTHQIALAQNAYRSDSVVRMKELLASAQPQRRGWEWNYLNWLADRSALTLRGHGEAVRCVAATRDGRYFITGGWDTHIIVWDAATGAEVRRLTGHRHSVHALALHPDGRRLFSSSYDLSVRAWDIETGAQLAVYSGPSGECWGVAINPDGTRVAVGSADHSLWVWDIPTTRPVWHHAHHTDRVTDVAFTRDGGRIISTGSDSMVRVTDASTGKELTRWAGHTWRVNCVAISPDGTRAASGDDDKIVRIWDTAAGEEVAALRGHGAGIMSLDFSPDGRQLVTGSWDKKIKLWDVASAQELLTLPGHGDIVWSVRFSPDGTRVISGSNDWTAKVWSLGAGGEVTKLAGHHLAVTALAWSPDSRRLASGGFDGTVRIWDAATGSELRTLRMHHSPMASIAFNREGTLLYSFESMGHLAVSDTATGQVHSYRDMTPRWRSGGSLSADGARLGTYADDGTPCLIDTDTGKMLLRMPDMAVIKGAISNDGRLLATSDNENNISLVDAESGSVIWSARAHHYPIRCVAFSADGKWLASGSEDRSLKLWDVASGALLHTLQGHELGVSCVAFAADSARLASGGDDRTVKLWDPATGQEVLTLRGHEQEISMVAFSPDGRVLASAGVDWTIRLWECGPPAGGFGNRPIVLEAQQVVHQIRKFANTSIEIADRIDANEHLTPAVREEALRIVRTEGDDLDELIERAWAQLEEPDPGSSQMALGLAEAARRISPASAVTRDVLGVSQCRTGQWRAGAATLAAPAEGECGPINLAYRAMACAHLGDREGARALLGKARINLFTSHHIGNRRCRNAVHDAAVLIDPQPTGPSP